MAPALFAAPAISQAIPYERAIPYEQAILYEIVARYPHRTGAFTQGLDLIGDTLYESSGLYGKSYVARWQLRDDQAIERKEISPQYFAEGLTILGDKAYLLTWQSGVGIVLNANTLALEGTFNYSGEGWGLTHNHRDLIMSDGSSRLRFIDPKTLRETTALAVNDRGAPMNYLNELEWLDAGAIAAQPRLLANIWKSNRIAVIDPVSGNVTGHIDLDKLHPSWQRRGNEDVLNGIAFDAADNTLLVTGKHWRHMWRIRLLQPLP